MGLLSVVVLVGGGLLLHGIAVEAWWIRMLRAGDSEQQRKAAELLGKMGSVRAVPYLVRKLRETETVRTIPVVEESDMPKADYAGTNPRTDIYWTWKGMPVGTGECMYYYALEEAAAALIEIGEPAIPAVIDLLESTSVYVRAQAIYVLGSLGSSARNSLPALAAQRVREQELGRAIDAVMEKIRAPE